ncbi:MAG: hypothetical protein CMB52_02445 [Euryarchaeota archaeon]|nr:hypothetical protein [Euryarchaeota archaeon]|tara:strand:+ start:884 stop:1183 length:300 start_codon:yes stop_codon:yes gene_type:complete
MSEPHVEVTPELIERYFALTQAAREKATPLHSMDSEEGKRIVVMMEMADSYTSDAKWFAEQGDLVRAFGAINYAHAWIDCAVKIGLMDGHGDDEMFTLP